jgi:hypothetical protein
LVLPDGSSPFPSGVMPDVPVKIANTVEREAVLISTNITLTASLQTRLKKKTFSEADLVKAFNGGAMSLAEETPEGGLQLASTNSLAALPATETGGPEVRDYVLERAVDIMKGIRVFSAAP